MGVYLSRYWGVGLLVLDGNLFSASAYVFCLLVCVLL